MPNWYCRDMTTIQVPKELDLFNKRLESVRPAGTGVFSLNNGYCLTWRFSGTESRDVILDELQMFIQKEATLWLGSGCPVK
jgi:hypothetical protein